MGTAPADPPRAPRPPDPRLRGLVTAYHGYRLSGPAPALHRGLPSSALTVVVAFEEPLEVGWLERPETTGRYWAMVSGLHMAPAAIRHSGFQCGIQLGLTPAGTRALLGMPAGALRQHMVPLVDLLGPFADRLYDEVASAASWEQRFDVLDRMLLATAGDGVAIGAELRRAWAVIKKSHGVVRVADLADEVGWSRRHLHARFTAEFGIAPKEAARLRRFQRSRNEVLHSRGRSLAEVAAGCGFADQAHLAREWRELAGCSPTTWLREELPFVQAGDVDA